MRELKCVLLLLLLIVPLGAFAQSKTTSSRKSAVSKKNAAFRKSSKLNNKMTLVEMDRHVTEKLGQAPKQRMKIQFKRKFVIRKVSDISAMINSMTDASMAGKLDRSAFNALGMGHGDYFNMFSEQFGGGVGGKASVAVNIMPGDPRFGSAAGASGLGDPRTMIQGAANMNAGFMGNSQSHAMAGSGEEGVTTEVEAKASSYKTSSKDADGNVTTESEVVHTSTVTSSDGNIQTSTQKSSTDQDGNVTYMQIVTHTDGQGGWKTSVTQKTKDGATGKWTGFTRYQDSSGTNRYKDLGSALPPDVKGDYGTPNAPLTEEEAAKFKARLRVINSLKGGDPVRPGMGDDHAIATFADAVFQKLMGTKGGTTIVSNERTGEGNAVSAAPSVMIDENGQVVNGITGVKRHTK